MKRSRIWAAMILSGALLAGCAKEAAPVSATEPATVGAAGPASAPNAASTAAAGKVANEPSVVPAADGRVSARKVLRKADLALEVRAPAQAETEVTTITERAGGYVASSAREARAEQGTRELSRVTLTLRVPSEKLGSVLSDLKRLGVGSATESLSSDDVSDEYIDLEARLKNQRALEDELRELLKRASTVEDALKVQAQLAGVRTEIDRMEGRRRFIDQEAAFATVTLALNELRPLVAATPRGFGHSVREALSDSLDIGASVIIGSIRLTGVLLPLVLLLGLPGALLLRWLTRSRRARLAAISS